MKVLTALLALVSLAAAQPMDLSGEWRVKLDRENTGASANWAAAPLADAVPAKLPGTLNTNGIGDDVGPDTPWMGDVGRGDFKTAERYAPYRQAGENYKVPFWLQPDKYFKGKAWYQREIVIPDSWKGKTVRLMLERCHWGSEVFLDGKSFGTQTSLCTPHRYTIPAVQPGKHLLTICIDNNYLIRVGPDASSITDHTQTNWNGIVGEIFLTAENPATLENLRVYPDLAGKSARITGTLRTGGTAVSGSLEISAESFNSAKSHKPAPLKVPLSGTDPQIDVALPMGEGVLPWDEFDPALYRLAVSFSGGSAAKETKTLTFGMRDLKVDGRTILINGVPRYFRGTLDCGAFPKTGHPPADIASWRKIYQTCKAYGLNHIRFHSWCPPRAAFDAADLEGMYLQPECGVWRGTCPFKNVTPVEPFLYEEGKRVLEEYGNHPSFVFFAHGNEPWELDQKKLVNEWVPAMRKYDPRHLITAAAHFPVSLNNDFQDLGPMGGMNLRLNPIAKLPPGTNEDYTPLITKDPKPVISHEPGEWCVYPNLDEIAKYNGSMKARNFEIVRDFLTKNHMLPRAKDFLMASGRFQTVLYKEETEKFLRTPGLAGFQMLGLNDFPGQGTALVGAVDAFYEPKPYVTGEEYNSFGGAIVPLALMEKRVWTPAETFRAKVVISQYSNKILKDARPAWKITNADGRVLASGNLKSGDIPVGNTTVLGEVSLPLSTIERPSQLTLTVGLPGTKVKNEWNFWVFPKPAENPAGSALVTSDVTEAIEAASGGKSVLLLASPKSVNGKTAGTFAAIFWNKPWFPGQKEHTVGWLIREKHPALRHFPTASHVDWQWRDLMDRSKPIILDGLPPALVPIAEPIDDWNTCRRLATVFEAAVGKGRLLVSSIDLTTDLANRPAAATLLASLTAYAQSADFQPAVSVPAADLAALFSRSSAGIIASARASSENPNYPAAHAIDGDSDTIWHTEWEGASPPAYPHEISFELVKPRTISGVSFLPRQDMNSGHAKDLEISISSDGKTWKQTAATSLSDNLEWKKVSFAPAEGKFLKIRFLTPWKPAENFCSFAEISLETP